jgi:hypothetical protein
MDGERGRHELFVAFNLMDQCGSEISVVGCVLDTVDAGFDGLCVCVYVRGVHHGLLA